jgi:hypothetical protein
MGSSLSRKAKQKRLFGLKFGQPVAGVINVFSAVTMPAGHLVGLDNPVMGAAWADFAFPPFRCDEFAIFGKFQRTIPHINLHLIDAPKVTKSYRENVSSFFCAQRPGHLNGFRLA